MSRDDIIKTILARLRAVCQLKGIVQNSFDESTVLIGSEDALLDSLGVVLLLVQVEESLNASSGIQTVLVQRLFAEDLGNETVGTLADRCLVLMGNRV